jgi:hypothetical protein
MMFWVIFDTSTKRDYYRDVHNLLALPAGATIRYDYNENHLSVAALEEARKGNASAKKVLVAYAQSKNFKKGGADHRGPIPYEQGLWVATRLANLRHLQFSVNRYYFYLEVLGYPATDDAAFGAIIKALATTGDTPFARWVAVSNFDAQFDALSRGTASENWASVINRIGNSPSQFAGDSFWRIAKVGSGPQKSDIQPVLREHSEGAAGTETITAVEAVFPIFELDTIALQIESRLPETGEERKDKEPEKARTVTFETAPDSPIKDLNGRALTLRRYAPEWIETEVGGSDRIDAQLCDLRMRTGPEEGAYPIGPEFSLRFRAIKQPWRAYFGLLSGIIAVVCLAVGGAMLKDYLEWGIGIMTIGVFLGIVAYFVWSGRVKFPGGR